MGSERTEYKRQWCLRNPEKAKAYKRKERYGLTSEEHASLLNEQGGTCALCVGPPTCVDHDHVTGVVRGLLCVGCNFALGHYERLLDCGVTKYLRRTNGKTRKRVC